MLELTVGKIQDQATRAVLYELIKENRQLRQEVDELKGVGKVDILSFKDQADKLRQLTGRNRLFPQNIS